MHQFKHYLKKYLKIFLVIIGVTILYQGYNYYFLGSNALKNLYLSSSFAQAREQTMINEAKFQCLQNNGLWKVKTFCGRPGRLIGSPDYPTLADYECYEKYSDGGNPCANSGQCEGGCRSNGVFFQPLGVCDETNEPTCCNDLMEDQNDPGFGGCDF